MALSWTMASAICSVQRMPERSIRSLMRLLHAPSTRATGDRPAVGEIFVIAHAGAVSVKVIGDSPQRFTRGPGQAAFGDTLTNPLDDLADIAEQDSQGAVEDPEFGFQAALGMEDIGGFPQFLQSVHQVQNQGDSQLPVDSNLQRSLAVGQGH